MDTTERGSGPDEEGSAVQYLSFVLDHQIYAVPIVQVQEIRGGVSVTPLPNAPAYILGVLNLRGTIIPVIDLRLRFGLPYRPLDASSVVVVVNIGERLAGLMVDAVSDVVDAGAGAWRDSPDFDGRAKREFIAGLIDIDRQIVIVLKTEALDELSEGGREIAA